MTEVSSGWSALIAHRSFEMTTLSQDTNGRTTQKYWGIQLHGTTVICV